MVWVVWLRRAMGRHGRFENFRIGTWLSNQIGTADSNRISKLRRSLVLQQHEVLKHEWLGGVTVSTLDLDVYKATEMKWSQPRSQFSSAAYTVATEPNWTEMPFQLHCTDCTKRTNWQFHSFHFTTSTMRDCESRSVPGLGTWNFYFQDRKKFEISGHFSGHQNAYSH